MAPPTSQKPQPTTPAWEVLNKDGTPAGQAVNLQFGADPNEVWRIADLVGERVAKDLRGEVAKVRSDMSARLDTHEKTAAEAATLAAERDKVTADTLKKVVEQLDKVEQAVNALTARIDPLETEVERERWIGVGEQRARAELTGARPSPLVVMPPSAPAPPPASWLQDWTPNKLLVLVGMVSAAMSGAAVDWPAIVRELVRGVAGTP